MRPALVLLAIVVGALLLRLPGLDGEMWLDEIITHDRVAERSAGDLLVTYESQNQHVLYSLAARLSLDVLGDRPAALRAPAVAFGLLGIVALFLFAREVGSSREALLASALLAVSYQHVWFSQNARGYTALLFFTLLASWLFLRGLARDRRSIWVAYAVAVALGVYTHLTMLFVVAGHVVMALRRRRVADLGGFAIGLGIAGTAALLLYLPIAGQLVAVTAVEGRARDIPEWISTRWAASEVVEALSRGFGHPVLALLAAVVGAAGVWRLWRRGSPVIELLVLPVAIGGVLVVASGHHLWPRLFFFAIGFAAIVAVAGAFAIGEALARRAGRLESASEPSPPEWGDQNTRFERPEGTVRRMEPPRAVRRAQRARGSETPSGFAQWGEGRVPLVARNARTIGSAIALVLVLVSATSLPGAYGPKQRYREAMAFVRGSIAPGDAVVTVGPAARVYEYYGTGWPRVRTRAELEEIQGGAARTWVVHSFPIHVRSGAAGAAQALAEGFDEVARFAGTVNGGDVVVWLSRPSRLARTGARAGGAGAAEAAQRSAMESTR